MKSTISSLSLTSLLILLAATTAGLAGAPLPAALSAETLVGAFVAAGTIGLLLAEYSRSPRLLRALSQPGSAGTRLLPAAEAFVSSRSGKLHSTSGILNG